VYLCVSFKELLSTLHGKPQRASKTLNYKASAKPSFGFNLINGVRQVFDMGIFQNQTSHKINMRSTHAENFEFESMNFF